MKFISRTALLASFWAMSAHSLLSCSSGEPTFLYDDGTEMGTEEGEPGFLKLALTAGGTQVNNVIAEISGKHGFNKQTHNIDVSDNNGIISIFFGGLPEGKGYSIRLTAGQCTGRSDFNIQADQTTLVSVILRCPGDEDGPEPKETGSVSVTGVIQGGGDPNAGCDHVHKIVAAPAIQDGDGPTSTVELVPNHGTTPTTVAWSSASTTGGAGTISNQSGAADTQVSFDCTSNGIVYVIANVTAPQGSGSCSEQARAAIDCRNQGPSLCGNGQINPPEQCDGVNIPQGQPVGTTCNSQCQLVPPTVTTCDGDGVIDVGEQCDGAAFPATAPLGSTCVNCNISHQCGNNVRNPPEQCDGTDIPGSAPLGATCDARCALVHQCGNGVVNPPEQCEPPGTTICNQRCQTVGGTQTCNNNVIEGTEQCDGTSLPATAPLGATCSNCTLVHQCNNGVINTGEQCDGAARPAGVTGGTCDTRCVCTGCTTTGGQTCGNNVIEGTEQCDGTNIPATAPLGATCTNCQLVHQCGNNAINAGEECDGTALPSGQTGTCDARCDFTPGNGGLGACGQCAAANCASQRADVDANLTLVDPILDCVLGASWPAGNRAATTSCGNVDLLTCYCGTLQGQDCANAAPSALNGQCVQQVLAGTGCSVSSCVAPIFLDPANMNGKAMQYIQCQQDFCFEDCFNL